MGTPGIGAGGAKWICAVPLLLLKANEDVLISIATLAVFALIAVAAFRLTPTDPEPLPAPYGVTPVEVAAP